MDNLIDEFIKEISFLRYPREACGFVYADKKGKPHCIECKNVSDQPEDFFLIDPKDFVETEKLGKIVACWHTHVDIPPTASDADRQGCKNTQIPWLIGSVYKTENGFRFEGLERVEVDNEFEVPLRGRPYVFGVFDCFSLMRDYYHRELKIDLPDLPRTERIWESEDDYMAKQAVSHFGLVRIPDDAELQRGDLCFIQTGLDGADHIGIYLGNDQILHQMRNRLSRIDVYGGSYWQEHTISKWRHSSRC